MLSRTKLEYKKGGNELVMSRVGTRIEKGPFCYFSGVFVQYLLLCFCVAIVVVVIVHMPTHFFILDVVKNEKKTILTKCTTEPLLRPHAVGLFCLQTNQRKVYMYTYVYGHNAPLIVFVRWREQSSCLT